MVGRSREPEPLFMAALAPAGSMNKIVLMYCTYRYAALYEISYGRKRTAEVTEEMLRSHEDG